MLFLLGISALVLLAGCSSVAEDASSTRFRQLPADLSTDPTKQDDAVRTTGTTGQGDVQIDLTSLGFKDGILKVEVAANTHSVDLSRFDLKELTTLEIDGQESRPTDAPSLGGHHARGMLIFNPQKEADTYRITITGIPQPQIRTYAWGR
ncbi:MAG: hypothetical protein GXP63_06780 [DPANN group archaeon]|nr:hypothetical protein [DPANN group archaeon]